MDGDKDPSTALMGRFQGHKPPVRRVSRSVYRDVARGVRDRKTGEKGLIFNTDEIKWRSNTKVEAEGGYFANGRAASWNTYIVELRKGRWVVTKDTCHAIA